jgi:hypothetical protein
MDGEYNFWHPHIRDLTTIDSINTKQEGHPDILVRQSSGLPFFNVVLLLLLCQKPFEPIAHLDKCFAILLRGFGIRSVNPGSDSASKLSSELEAFIRWFSTFGRNIAPKVTNLICQNQRFLHW